MIINTDFKVGILGGGQLGKMLALAAGNWDLNIWSMDKSAEFPAAAYSTHFVEGDFNNYDDVYNFGKQVDVLTIEIEHVNTDALIQLEKEGVKIHPSPTALNIIKDKGLQKQFYVEKGLPTSPFELYVSDEAIKESVKTGTLSLPFVQKSRGGGYDGKGVAVIRTLEDLEEKLLPVSSMVEPLVDIDKEIAVVAARNEKGDVIAFPAVEMEFNPIANLVEFLVCPANISKEIEVKAEEIALKTISAYDVCGLLAVELFLTKSGEILINEVAPRPHNSGHHTTDSCYTSQFQQHLRAILNWSLGTAKMKTPSVMVNLLGTDGFKGQAYYEGLDKVMEMRGVNLHLYGKKMTKPYRKMGHATVIADSVNEAKEIAKQVQDTLIIKTL